MTESPTTPTDQPGPPIGFVVGLAGTLALGRYSWLGVGVWLAMPPESTGAGVYTAIPFG